MENVQNGTSRFTGSVKVISAERNIKVDTSTGELVAIRNTNADKKTIQVALPEPGVATIGGKMLIKNAKSSTANIDVTSIRVLKPGAAVFIGSDGNDWYEFIYVPPEGEWSLDEDEPKASNG